MHQHRTSGSEQEAPRKAVADSVFFELTRSICPECRTVIDAHVLLRDGRVYMRKRCPAHGQFEALIYGDAEAYVANARFNKPGEIPLEFATEVAQGCPHDCGLCPDHQQHACVGIIEVNSGCNMDCPLCFANAAPGFSLTLEEVEYTLDRFVAAEGRPDVVQFSGGEPTIHPEIIAMIRAAQAREIPLVMINTNGRRIANDDAFVAQLAEVRPAVYLQFDGFDDETYRVIRGEPGLLQEKLRALDRLAEIDAHVVLVPAIERHVNDHEVGDIVRFAIEHPAVRGVNFQPAFHAGRHDPHDPLERVTIPDVIGWIEAQTDGLFARSDFVPIPCCFPTCNSVSYGYIDEDSGAVTPLPRLIDVEEHLDFITNRAVPDPAAELRAALEGLWSTAALPGAPASDARLALSCAVCDLPALNAGDLSRRFIMIMLQDFMDPWTFNQKNVMKCCKEILLPDGKQIPFCAYNSVGYREQATEQLAAQQRARHEARRTGAPFHSPPLRFEFPRRSP
ncbi:MAG: radical SAM protein [Dehalococcoidia bacterium]